MSREDAPTTTRWEAPIGLVRSTAPGGFAAAPTVAKRALDPAGVLTPGVLIDP